MNSNNEVCIHQDDFVECNERWYYLCQQTGSWKSVIGYSIPEEITAICKKFITLDFIEEMNAEVFMVNLLRQSLNY